MTKPSSFEQRLVSAWYQPHLVPLTVALAPLSAVYAAVAALRRGLYRVGLFRAERLPVPVIVVGNLTAGGSGKTPLVAALARQLVARGWRPGIVSRGYGRVIDAGAEHEPLLVSGTSDPGRVGDEPLLLARAGFPVAVARDRVAAGRALLEAHPECDVVLTDDGLQHYRLHRDVEVAVVDGERGLGNRRLLPAGPLREAPARLSGVDAVVVLVREKSTAFVPDRAWPEAWPMQLEGTAFHRVASPEITADASAFGGAGVHAIAGIGHPQRFFDSLRAMGIRSTNHAFPDHHRFVAADLAWPDAASILMTEKDAVKCAAFADERCWFLPVQARIDAALVTRIEEKLRGRKAA
mgnify:CR=1 FL=1